METILGIVLDLTVLKACLLVAFGFVGGCCFMSALRLIVEGRVVKGKEGKDV